MWVEQLICRNKMTRLGGKNLTHNRLWLARRRRGLRQKQVAFLLHHHTVDQISRYEQGRRLPTLETALKLEIVLGVPLRVLFQDHFERLRAEVQQRVEGSRAMEVDFGLLPGEEGMGEYCAYAELLDLPLISQAETGRVRTHITRLARRLAYL